MNKTAIVVPPNSPFNNTSTNLTRWIWDWHAQGCPTKADYDPRFTEDMDFWERRKIVREAEAENE